MFQSSTFQQLLDNLSSAPGFGNRSAKRFIMHLARNPKNVSKMINVLQDFKDRIKPCNKCYNIDCESELCHICQDTSRDFETICVVENPEDIWSIEGSGYKGCYHVIGGHLSPSDGIMPENLNISELIERLSSSSCKEVIFSNNASLESRTTMFYITNLIKEQVTDISFQITEFAHGVPLGTSLEYIDKNTIEIALKSRTCLKS